MLNLHMFGMNKTWTVMVAAVTVKFEETRNSKCKDVVNVSVFV
jgi:hypothetical protein